jgi:predicted transcriptional regulator
MIGVRVDASLEEKLKLAAEKERRTVSQFARNILADAVDKPQPVKAEVAA